MEFQEETLKINDGGGLFDACGLIDSLIMDCNELPKKLMSGNYVSFCASIVEMVQKLSALRNGVEKDTKAKEETIKDLQKANEELAELTVKEKDNA